MVSVVSRRIDELIEPIQDPTPKLSRLFEA